jgi:NitT/TauT family transport system substrate-binding protein
MGVYPRLIGAAVALFGAATVASAQDSVTFALSWIPGGNHFGVIAADVEGFYRDVNVKVDIQRGNGSGDTVKRVATGSADIGVADATSVIDGVRNGLKVKQVAVIFERAPDSIFFVKDRGISAPKDLEGRKLGAATGEAPLNTLPLFAKHANFAVDKVSIINMTPSAKYASLVAGSVDAIVEFINLEPTVQQAAAKTGLKIGKFVYAEYGVDYYSLGLVVNDAAVDARPDLLRRLVSATMRGYAWAIKNPDAAADDFAKSYPESSRDVALAQWKVSLPFVLTETTKSKGIGYIDDGKMQTTLDVIRSYKPLDPSVKPGDVYTLKFLPKIAAD